MTSFDLVIVTYDSAAALPDCLESARTFFAGAPHRLIVVDNASRDDSVAVVEASWPDATLIRNERNAGFAAAVNQATAAGDGDVVVLVNPDLRFETGDAATVAGIFAGDARIAAVAGTLHGRDGALERSCKRDQTLFSIVSLELSLQRRFPGWKRARRHYMLDWDMSDQRDVDDACGALLFIRRAALDDVGPLDERFFMYYEETDWLRRARDRGWRVVYTPAIVSAHHIGESTSEPPAALKRHLLESGYLFHRKHGGRRRELASRGIHLATDSARVVWYAVQARSPEARARLRVAWMRLPLHLGLRTRTGRAR